MLYLLGYLVLALILGSILGHVLHNRDRDRVRVVYDKIVHLSMIIAYYNGWDIGETVRYNLTVYDATLRKERATVLEEMETWAEVGPLNNQN